MFCRDNNNVQYRIFLSTFVFIVFATPKANTGVRRQCNFFAWRPWQQLSKLTQTDGFYFENYAIWQRTHYVNIKRGINIKEKNSMNKKTVFTVYCKDIKILDECIWDQGSEWKEWIVSLLVQTSLIFIVSLWLWWGLWVGIPHNWLGHSH